MGQRAQWPESRSSVLISPEVEALGGKTYRQSGQTAGSLGGRRSKEVWFGSGDVGSAIGMVVKVAGGIWRLIEVSARVRVAPTTGSVSIDIFAQAPGEPSPVSVLSTLLTISSGQKEATGGVLKVDSKMLPIGTLVSMGTVPGPWAGIIVSVYDAGNGKTATLHHTGGAWTKQSEDATSWPTVALHHFAGMGNTIFRCRSNGDNYDGWLTLQRSPDLGVTWNDTAVEGCSDIAQAPNGDLYAIGTGGDGQPHRIYRSIDSSDSWTEVYEDTTGGAPYTVYRRIGVDPSDSDHVIVVGWDSGGGTQQVFLRTTDATQGASATYTRTEPTLTSLAEKNEMAFCFGRSGRLFWAYENSAGSEVLVDTSDNNGSSWDARLSHSTTGNPPPRTIFLSGTDIYILVSSSGGIKRSPDNGLTWENFTNLPTMTAAKAIAVSHSLDVIYAGQNNAAEAYTVQQMQPIATVGSWTDISADLLAITGFSDVQLCSEGLALPMGAATAAVDLTTELHYRTQVVSQ